MPARLDQELMLRSLASVLTSRGELATLAGRTFGELRDVFAALGYKASLLPADYKARYRRNAVAARVVEAFPRGTWRGDSELIEIPDPEKITDFEKQWDLLATRLRIWPTLMRTDILAGLGRFSVLLLGCPGSLNTELPKEIKTEELVFLSAFGEDDVTISDFENSQKDERFGLPKIYKVKRLDSKNVGKETDIHWSRIIHVADGLLDDEVYGQPRLERVWNLIDDLEKITGAGSEAFWLRAHQGYQFDLDKEVELGADEETAFSDEIDKFMHGLQRAFRTRGVTVQALGSDVATFDRNVESIISQISSGTGIPQRILMGSEQGQLASEQDRVNWSERIQDRRTEYAAPQIVHPFVDRLIKHGILPKPAQYSVRWPKISDLSDEEKARIAVRWAEINQKYGSVVVKENEIRDRILQLEPLTEEEIKKFHDEAQAAAAKNTFGGNPGDSTNKPTAENRVPSGEN